MNSHLLPHDISPLSPWTCLPPPPANSKLARIAAGLSQVQAAELMGYPVQQGSRGGLQSRTWQALESETDERTMQGPVFAMFLLLTGQHPTHALVKKPSPPTRARARHGPRASSERHLHAHGDVAPHQRRSGFDERGVGVGQAVGQVVAPFTYNCQGEPLASLPL